MLGQMTSRQLTEWAAYEKVAGPVDRRYDQEVLASIHEQLQSIAYLLGAAHFTDDEHENPVEAPKRYNRPEDVFAQGEQDDEEVVVAREYLENQQQQLSVLEYGTPEYTTQVEVLREAKSRLDDLVSVGTDEEGE